MTDLLLTVGLSNLLVSTALALLAWGVQITGKRPLIAHLLWLLVLVKLVTPPLFTVPIMPVPGFAAGSAKSAHVSPAPEPEVAEFRAGSSAAPTSTAHGAAIQSPEASTRLAWWSEQAKTWLALLWLAGSIGILAWSLARIHRFHRLLRTISEKAPPEVQRVATEIGGRLGLTHARAVYVTAARLSPMVWWIGGRACVIIPSALPGKLGPGELRWILAHELAHIRRRDHLVRWLEWLACVCFWWNPVAWWARRNLRVNEEVCCDAHVLESLRPATRSYANALMSVVEFLATPAIRPPAMASAILSGGFLERRFRMIVSSNTLPRTPRWLLALLLVCAVGLLPLGVAYGQRPVDVEAGELALDQARIMQDEDLEAKKKRYAEIQHATEAAVREGKISREDAEKRLIEARKKIFGSRSHPESR